MSAWRRRFSRYHSTPYLTTLFYLDMPSGHRGHHHHIYCTRELEASATPPSCRSGYNGSNTRASRLPQESRNSISSPSHEPSMLNHGHETPLHDNRRNVVGRHQHLATNA